MTKLRGIPAVVLFLGSAIGASGACMPPALEVPTKLPQAEIPQAPEIPSFEPPAAPEVQTPDAPQVPLPPGQGGGNCCIRTGVLLESKCKGASSCCVKDLDNIGDCEDAKGFWFFSEEGCAGAC